MFCSRCGKQIPEGSKFCVNCGAPVEQPQFQQPQYQQPQFQQPAVPEAFEAPVEQAVETFEAPVEQAVEAFEAPVEEAVETFEAPVEEAVEAFEAPVEEAVETFEAPVEEAVETFEAAPEQAYEAFEEAVPEAVEEAVEPAFNFDQPEPAFDAQDVSFGEEIPQEPEIDVPIFGEEPKQPEPQPTPSYFQQPQQPQYQQYQQPQQPQYQQYQQPQQPQYQQYQQPQQPQYQQYQQPQQPQYQQYQQPQQPQYQQYQQPQQPQYAPYPPQYQPQQRKPAVPQKGKGGLMALHAVALLFPIGMLVIWFLKTFVGETLSFHSVYMAAGETEAIWKYLGYAAIGVMGLNILLLLLPAVGLGTRSRVPAVLALILTLLALFAGGYIVYEFLSAGYELKEVPVLVFVFFGCGLLAIIFDFILIAKGGRK